MSDAQKLAKIGNTDFRGSLFDHRWDDPDELITLGELSAETVDDLTGGLIDHAVPVSINKLLAPGIYDTVVVLAPQSHTKSPASRAARSIFSRASPGQS